jgi:hypothetical protein
MDDESEVALECIDYQRNDDGTGGTAVIEVPTCPRGLLLRISGVQLIRTPPARQGYDDVVPLWSMQFPAQITLGDSDRNTFRTAVMAAVVRYEKAIEAGECRPCKPKLRLVFSAKDSEWPRPLTALIQ